MQHLRFSFRVKSFAFCMLVVLLVIASIPLTVSAQDEGEMAEEHSGQSCGECHLDYHAAWEQGVHAIAYTRESFQEAWAAEDNNPECLQCHTTSYQPARGEYHAENIQCEACHGLNPASHPPEVFVVQTDAGTCGDCHTPTFDEWQNSMHAFSEDMGAIGCATCHNPHGQTVRFETVDELCINCHKDNPDHSHPYTETYVHVTHNEIEYEEVNVTCASCHMYNKHHDELHQLPDHTMDVETIPCTDCHETLSETGDFDTLLAVDLELAEERDALRMQVHELEAELETTAGELETQSGTDYVQLTQGLIIGLGVGMTIIYAFLRRMNGRNGNG